MNNKEFKREKKEKYPIVAICYDFDKTLTPNDMQAQCYIQSIGKDVNKFWEESESLAINNNMDTNLAWMFKMKKESEYKEEEFFTKKSFKEYGSRIQFFPGVKDWFKRIKKYGKKRQIIIEHYIISSGLREMIEGTSIFKCFKKVYASSFYYNKKKVAIWPAQVINYTNKTQFLFRIEKGILDINDPAVNDHFSQDQLRIPFENIIYIGDSVTDIPCMKLVNSYGGHSIGVYNSETQDKTNVYKMMQQERIKYFAPADYSEGKELDSLVKAIIDRTKYNEELKSKHFSNKKEVDEMNNGNNCSQSQIGKLYFIDNLENSFSLRNSYTLIKEAAEQEYKWTSEEIEKISKIATDNLFVSNILKDDELLNYYNNIVNDREIKEDKENGEEEK